MKKTNQASLLLSLVMLSGAAHCAPYISGQVGTQLKDFTLETYDVLNGVTQSINSKHDLHPTGRIAAGYLWELNHCLQLGLEAGATANQNIKFENANLAPLGWNNAQYKRWSADLLGVADYYVTERFDVFAKAGAAYAKQKLTKNSGDFINSISNYAIVPKGVIGVGYDVTENVNINLSLNHEFKRGQGWLNENNNTTGMTSALIGVKYTFS